MKKLIFTVLFAFSIFAAHDAIAGGGPPGPPVPPGGGGGPGGPPCWPPPCVPIDGGIGLLLVAGALYGGKKIYDISKKAE